MAGAAGGSQAQLSRLEHGRVRHVDVVQLSRVLAATGLRLSMRTFPEGSPIRDTAHVALLRRLRALLAPAWSWRLEVPVQPGSAQDARRWDALAGFGPLALGFEAETRLYDAQASSPGPSPSRPQAASIDSSSSSRTATSTDASWRRSAPSCAATFRWVRGTCWRCSEKGGIRAGTESS